MSISSPNFDPDWPVRASVEDGRLLVGRYLLLEKIGEGGAAEVFRARDERLERVVAVKLLRLQYVSDPMWRQRFEVEAKAAAGLLHPGIVNVYDFGEGPDGTMFIVMQYVEGQNLRDVLRKRGRMSPAEAASLARQVCDALSIAHNAGLVHRDVKPQNILIDSRGDARLTDFGIVKALSGPALTQTGMTFGTAAYLSPEQATGAPVGPTSDIYSLGCVIYEMLSGTPPFSGENPMVVAYKQVWEQPRPLHDLVPSVPPSLESVVMRCLHKDPGGRYPSTAALALDLERVGGASARSEQHILPDAVVLSPVAGAEKWQPDRSNAPTEPASKVSASASPVSSPYAVPPVPMPVQTASAAAVPSAPQLNGRASPSTLTYVTGVGGNVQSVHVLRQKGIRWLPVAAILGLMSLALLGFAATRGKSAPTVEAGNSPPAAGPTSVIASQAPEFSPTVSVQLVVATLPTSTPTALPSDTPTLTLSPTNTPLPPTDIAIPPTNTPLPPATATPPPPPSSPIDTPLPSPPSPTYTPLPPPPTNTTVPPTPTAQATNTPLPVAPQKTHKPKSTPVSRPTDTPLPPRPTDTPLPKPPRATDMPVPPVPTAASDLERVVDEAIAGNPKAVADYLGGKKTALVALFHDVLEKAKGTKIDINTAREVLLRKLEELRPKP